MKKKCPECSELFNGNKCGCGYVIPNSPSFKMPCPTCKSTGLVSAYKEGSPPKKFRDYAVFLCTCENTAGRQETHWVDDKPVRHRRYDFKATSEGWKI